MHTKVWAHVTAINTLAKLYDNRSLANLSLKYDELQWCI